ncbi:MAG TPA: hypothetical protein GX706_02180 [Candidatus Moranbacteria bacterium]|nr:hypothetical protein [Candidatus Moranbacteria bacterium]
MNTIKVVNLRCGGGEAKIIAELFGAGMKNVRVELQSGEISFEGDVNKAKAILATLGYVEVDTSKAKELSSKKIISSCKYN